MDVYRQAAEVIRIVREGRGTAKALCLRKEMQKKRQTYAVVCETLRHYELLEDVLAMAEFFKYYPQANHEYALCMAYDVVLGKGVNTHNDSTARAITQSAAYLREAYWRVRKHHVIAPRETDDTALEGQTAGGATTHGDVADGFDPLASPAGRAELVRKMPRYARVNTLKIDVDDLIARLRRAAEWRKRQRAEAAPQGSDDGGKTTVEATRRRGTGRVLPAFTLDPLVPQLLVFPPGTDLHAHPAVRSGQLVLQDRASCLPACILLDAVRVVRVVAPTSTTDAKTTAATKPAPLEYVIDACAAPGNKTTQLAALGAPRIKIMAIERDARRAELLQRRVQSLGASDYVNAVHMDFFDLSAEDRAATEGILLDPSCSASGVLTRVDVSLEYGRGPARGTHDDGDDEAVVVDDNDEGGGGAPAANTQEGGAEQPDEGRVVKLARLQRKLLAHALLSFDNCRTVVYSTCSIHEAENEAVVREVLQDARVQARGWTLSHIMPDEWPTRGHRTASDVFPLDHAIRCDPVTDATNGFFVARFDRLVAPPS